jgi:hypothetical protein
VLPTDHPKVLRARNGLLADGTIRRIERSRAPLMPGVPRTRSETPADSGSRLPPARNEGARGRAGRRERPPRLVSVPLPRAQPREQPEMTRTPTSFQYSGTELDAVAGATNYYNWIIERFAPFLGRRVVEVGAGIGTFSQFIVGSPGVGESAMHRAG